MNQTASFVPKNRQLVFAVALLVLLSIRTLFALGFQLTPDAIQSRLGDERYYVAIANHLLEFHEYKEGNLVAYRPPLYPSFVAVMLAATNGKLWLLQLTQNVLYLASVLLLGAIVLRLLGKKAALICCILLLVTPVWLAIPQEALSETLFIFLVTLGLFFASLLVTSGHTSTFAVLAGVMFGLSALTREIGLYLALTLLACLVLKRAVSFKHAVIACICTFAAILPWTVRNYAKLGAFILVDTNGPINLYEGNNPSANGKMHWALPPDVKALWNQPGTEMTVYRAAKAEAVEYAKSHPVQTLALLPAKVWYLWGPIPVIDGRLNADTAYRVVRLLFWIPYLVLALYGFFIGYKRWIIVTIAIWTIVTSAIHLLTITQPLYRAPMEFFLAIPVTFAILSFGKRTRASRALGTSLNLP
jgi:4-amino-4-deoxy-L-arabinose transferase-like glycosyltransferase